MSKRKVRADYEQRPVLETIFLGSTGFSHFWLDAAHDDFHEERFLLLGRWLEMLLLRWKIFAGAPLDRMCASGYSDKFLQVPHWTECACGYSDKFSQVPHWTATCVITPINFRRCPTGLQCVWLL